MPVLSHGGLEIEYSDAGDGPAVVLIHCSVSGIRQWRSLTEVLADRYRVRALNLYGYGATTPWPERETQTLEAQARIVVAACEGLGEPVSLVGHSFGGTVALKAATLLGSRVGSMVLIEPNPVYLLAQGGRDEEFAEVRALRDHVKRFGALGEWEAVAERFADYWVGDGAWSAMPEDRRAAFAGLLPPNFHEWDAAMGERTTVERPGRARVPDAGHERPRHAAADPRDRRDPRAGVSGLDVPRHPRGRPHGAADAARPRQSDDPRVPRRGLNDASPGLAHRERARRSARAPTRPRRGSALASAPVHDPRVLIAPAHALEEERAAIFVRIRLEGERLHLLDELPGRPGARIGAPEPERDPAPAPAGASHVASPPSLDLA